MGLSLEEAPNALYYDNKYYRYYGRESIDNGYIYIEVEYEDEGIVLDKDSEGDISMYEWIVDGGYSADFIGLYKEEYGIR